MNINVIINLKYLLNFRPKLDSLTNLIVENNKIYCKNLLIFLIFLEFFLKKNKYFLNVTLSTLQKKYKLNSFLRAPNKHKKAQISLCANRYYLFLKFNFLFLLPNGAVHRLPIFFYNLLESMNFFESTLVLMKTKKITFKLPLKNVI